MTAAKLSDLEFTLQTNYTNNPFIVNLCKKTDCKQRLAKKIAQFNKLLEEFKLPKRKRIRELTSEAMRSINS